MSVCICTQHMNLCKILLFSVIFALLPFETVNAEITEAKGKSFFSVLQHMSVIKKKGTETGSYKAILEKFMNSV